MRSFKVAVLAVAAVALAACGGPTPEDAQTETTTTASAPTSEAPPAAPAAAATPKLSLAQLPAPYSTADLAAGEMAFVQCRACHQTDPALGNTVGPNLHGVFDRAPGGLSEFRYSDALKGHAAKVAKWSPEELDKWLADPTGYLPGTAMFFNGVSDPAARQNLIAYLLIQTS